MSNKNETNDNFLEALSEYKPETSSTDQLFYVYFNDARNIICLSPEEDSSLSAFQYTKLPLSLVEEFIIGTKNPGRYLLEQDETDPTIYTIVPKILEINYLRRLDRFLTEVEPSNEYDGHIIINNNVGEKCFTFSLSHELRMKLSEQGTIESENITINGIPELDFHLTLKNDPSFLIETITIPTSQLIGHEHIYVNYENDLSSASLYTRKIFTKYSYIITHNEK